MNFGVFVLQKARIYITLYVNKTYPFSPFRPRKNEQTEASYGGLRDKNSLNECRCCRLTGGTNPRIPLRYQELSIVGHVDPDNSYKTHRLIVGQAYFWTCPTHILPLHQRSNCVSTVSGLSVLSGRGSPQNTYMKTENANTPI